MPMNRIELLEALRKMHPEIQWGEWPLGDYEQCAELDAPDILVCFGSKKENIEEGLADPYSTMIGDRCEPSHWGISVQAAEMVAAHNRVTVHKYPNNDGPRQKLS